MEIWAPLLKLLEWLETSFMEATDWVTNAIIHLYEFSISGIAANWAAATSLIPGTGFQPFITPIYEFLRQLEYWIPEIAVVWVIAKALLAFDIAWITFRWGFRLFRGA